MNPPLPRRRRASALILVIIFTVMVSLITASLINRVGTEHKLNTRRTTFYRLNNATDIAIDYGIGQIIARQRDSLADSPDAFTPTGARPLAAPAESLFAPLGSGLNRIRFQDSDVVASCSVKHANPDPSAPNRKWFLTGEYSSNDKLKNQWVDRNLIALAARVSVTSETGDAVTKHAMAVIERRDAYLFNYAIFFGANPLRVFNLNGTMEINGAIMANQGVYLAPSNVSDLKFAGAINTAGGFWNRQNPTSLVFNTATQRWVSTGATIPVTGAPYGSPLFNSDAGLLPQTSRVGNVRYSTDGGATYASMADDQFVANLYSPWLSSGSKNFTARATNLTQSGLQTKSSGITAVAPFGMVNDAEFTRLNLPPTENPWDNGLARNNNTLISVRSSDDPLAYNYLRTTLKAAESDVAHEWFSTDSRYSEVYINDPSDLSAAAKRGAYDTGSSAGQYDIAKERAIDAPRAGIATLTDAQIEAAAKTAAESGNAPGPADPVDKPTADQLYNYTKNNLLKARDIEAGKLAYKASLYVVAEADGTVTAFNDPARAAAYKAVTDTSPAAQRAARDKWKTNNPGDILDLGNSVTSAYVETGRTDTDGKPLADLQRKTIYDYKQGGTVTLVEIDAGNLKSRIDAASIKFANGDDWKVTDSTTNKAEKSVAAAESTKGWNGLLYVDVEQPNRRFSTIPSLKNWTTDDPAALDADVGKTAVRLVNAKELPASKVGTPGFTLATNAAVYTKGSVNADGNLATGTSRLQDDQTSATASSAKMPASIWADLVMNTSDAFSDLDLTVFKPGKNPTRLSNRDLDNWPFYAGSDRRYGGSSSCQWIYQKSQTGQVMEISAAIVAGDKAGTGGTANGLQNFVGYLEYFDTSTCTQRIRGSLVNLFTPRSFTGAYADSYFQNPRRDFGFSTLLQSGMMPPGTPVVRDYRRARFLEISPAAYGALKAIDTSAKDETSALANFNAWTDIAARVEAGKL